MPPLESIHRTYFGYAPLAGHVPGCRAATGPNNTGGWEVSIARDARHATDPQTGKEIIRTEAHIRLLCRSCGNAAVVHMYDPDFFEHTSVSGIGYGSTPERCAGMWLHPGQPRTYVPEDPGPRDYYVTGSPTPPADESEVLGIISRYLAPRQAQRWLAAYGQRPGGGAITNTDQPFKTKIAAVRWVMAEHARQLAALAAAADQIAASDDPAQVTPGAEGDRP